MNKCYGNYLGLVVNTTDPEKRGRVQVFVPNITPTLYKDWNETAKNKSFKTFESKSFSAEIKDRLQKHLPWAEAAVPFWGGSTGAPTNQSFGTPTPIPTDQNFNYDYSSFEGGDVVGLIGPKDNLSSGAHLDIRWGDANGNSSSSYVPDLGQLSKYISINGKPLTDYRITNDAADHINRGSSPAWDLAEGPKGSGLIEGRPIVLYNGARVVNSGSFSKDSNSGWVEVFIPEYNKTVKLLHLSSSSIAGATSHREGNPPKEAYADTRIFETDALASPLGHVNGDTGTIGSTSDILSEIRSIYGQDLANPDTLQTIYGLIKSEVGNLSDAGQLAFVETLFNRSYVQGDTLTDTVTNKNYFGVYGNGSYAKARQNLTQSDISKYNSLIQQALQGSNVSNGSAHAGQYGDPGINRNKPGGYEAIDSTKVEIADANGNVEVFYNKTTQLDKLGVLADVSGDASLITNGQNVVRTRTPDSYGSLTGPRTGGTMGFNSVPHVGSKVWVFFMGGDVQKPVYFATIYEPNNIA